jgi:hypothetical protein
MAKSSTEITVLIGDKPAFEYRDILDYSIDSSVLTLADSFELKIANPPAGTSRRAGATSFASTRRILRSTAARAPRSSRAACATSTGCRTSRAARS